MIGVGLAARRQMRDHIVFAIVLFATLVLLMACEEGGGADTEGPSLALTAEACETSECHDRVSATIQALRPTPIPVDPRMREILLENSAVEEMVAGGVEREDYWLNIDMFSSPANGDEGGMAVIVFAEPVSFLNWKTQTSSKIRSRTTSRFPTEAGVKSTTT